MDKEGMTEKRDCFGMRSVVVIAVISFMLMASLAWIALPASAAGAEYVKVDLGTLGWESHEPWGVNDNGQIVGIGRSSSGQGALLWDSGLVGNLETLGGSDACAFDVNDPGQIVGMSTTADEYDHATLWESGEATDLGTLGGDGSVALAISNGGSIVGYSQTSEGSVHAFLLEFGIMTDLGTLGGTRSEAYDLNEQGQIVGSSETVDGATHAFLWESGIMTDLGTLGGDESIARSINENGQIVGYATIPSGPYNAFLWDSGVMWSLGSGRGDSSVATAINDVGQVVGQINGDTFYKAAVWESGSAIELDPSDDYYSAATGINNEGLIVGVFDYPVDPNQGWLPCLWMKGPIEPEPAEPGPALDIVVDCGGLYFGGEDVELYAMVSDQGIQLDATSLAMTVTDPNGGSTELTPEAISTGLYKAVFTLPDDAPAGTYTLTVSAVVTTESGQLQGVTLKCFQVSATMAEWDEWLESINAVVVDIQGTIATMQTDLGEVKTDVDVIGAQVTDIHDRTASITTDFGDLELDVHWINATIMQTIGHVMKVKTTVGTVYVDEDDVDLGYLASAVDGHGGQALAELAGVVILVVSSFIAGVLTRTSVEAEPKRSALVRSAEHRKSEERNRPERLRR